ncbi:helix-turn-helix domain-containing protein [Microbacterium trichothecenolyticum]|uniref:Transcriptional regulator with XRE-family HTH domain n=1 Tax=Microbacterium trichothecenolyticum TaxID=69370 RepID=A0ABU0TPD1_MICTR|nr:XRE family transcriptional regulator [Microbacterium trichothecenolyticum]MDQ1121524.1 transcriptional regulator with XRE-family HTH domain [Microbacterium trichothecenolyticum]
MTDTDDVDRRIGESVRSARRERHLSTRQLAALAGVSQPTLSNIENGRIRAGVATLYLLADALSVPPARLLTDDDGSRRGHDQVSSGGVRLRALPTAPDAKLEVHEVVVPAGEAEEHSFQHGGEDVLLIVSGRGELTLGKSRMPIRAGDVVWIDATAPHRLSAAAEESLTVQVVTARLP